MTKPKERKIFILGINLQKIKINFTKYVNNGYKKTNFFAINIHFQRGVCYNQRTKQY